MSTNGINTADEAGMTAECDGEKVVTMMDVLQEQEEFEEDANAVLGASDDKNCTYSKGYIKRQAIYACLTCCVEAKDDPSKRAGVCLACSLTCHENHDLVELYTKRNFRCDCGNPKFNSHPCQFTPDKTELNEDNNYNQNFSGLYCICQRPYPDPESTFEDEMIQCIICEDWLHSSHLDATVPTNEQYAEMICKGCMEKNDFIHDYSDFAVNNESNNIDIMTVEGGEVISANTVSETNGTLEQTLLNGELKSIETNNENKTKEEMDVDTPAEEKESVDKVSDSDKNDLNDKVLESTVNENAMDTDKTEEISTTDIKDSENSEGTIQSETAKDIDESLVNKSENKVNDSLSNEDIVSKINDIIDETKETSDLISISETEQNIEQKVNKTGDAEQSQSNSKHCDNEKEITDESNSNMETSKTEGEPEKQEICSNIVNDDISKDNIESKSDESLEKEKSDNTEESVKENEEQDTDGSQPAIANDQKNDDNNQNESGEKESQEKSPIESLEESAQNENGVESAPKETAVESGPIENEIKSIDSAIDTDPTKSEDDCLPSEGEAKSVPNETEDKSVSVVNDDAQINSDQSSNKNDQASEDLEFSSNVQENEMEVSTEHEEAKQVPNETQDKSVTVENEVLQTNVDQSSNNRVSADLELSSSVQENKRKLSTEQSDTDETITKKAKLDKSNECARPKGIKRRFKGATFWPSNFRQKLCTCNECISMYKDLSVLFLIDPDDTVTAYETLGKEKINGAPASQYEKGLLALSSLDRVQQINALTEYNKMRDKLLDFLKSFKDRKEIVKEEDIKAFFAGMKPKREPDGVYFCR